MDITKLMEAIAANHPNPTVRAKAAETIKLAETLKLLLVLKEASEAWYALAKLMMKDAGGDFDKLTAHCQRLLDAKPLKDITAEILARRVENTVTWPGPKRFVPGKVQFALPDQPASAGGEAFYTEVELHEAVCAELRAKGFDV